MTREGEKSFSTLDVKVVDTTAAGDAFTAGVVVSLSEGKTLEEGIGYGHLVASVKVTKKGAQSAIPDKKEIEEYCKQIKNM